MQHRLIAAGSILLLGCAANITDPSSLRAGDPAVAVTAKAETAPVGTAAADAADDPAIWRNPVDPAASLIVGTDKKAGLYVYGLDGRTRSFLDAGRVNNVDLRPDVLWGNRRIILVAASDRSDPAQARIALFELDPVTAVLRPLGKVDAGSGEAYGICLARTADAIHAFLVAKDGTIRQVRLAATGSVIVRTLRLATQSEGCAVDEARNHLYVGEEDRGLWRFDANVTGASEPTLVAPADGKRIVADTEGVTVAGDYLVVSSQGDNAYAVWHLPDERFIGRFRISVGDVGATEETDGIELAAGSFGPTYPNGLFVVQDGQNAPAAQNFKLVSWADVLARLNAKGR